MTERKYVTDIHGQRRELLLPHLGEGQQGRVYALEGGQLAAKVLRTADQGQAARLESQLEFVQRLDLKHLRVARPKLRLQHPVGYIMELLHGKAPLAASLFPSRREDPRAFYVRTGGIERRYALLADLGRLLMNLHNQGLVYGDLSPNNVFIPVDLSEHETHLIDADNIRSTQMPGRTLFTPRYGAPEVVRGESRNNELTDTYAFAVIAFEYLTLQHPLIGDQVSQGTADLEGQALAGHLPWVGDASGLNASSHGVPHQAVLTDALWQLFTQCFGPGLQDPFARPTMYDWIEGFERGRQQILRCPACELSSLFGQPKWCEHPQPDRLRLTCSPHDPERERDLEHLDATLKDSAARELGHDGLPRLAPPLRETHHIAVQKDIPVSLSERDLGAGLGNTPVVNLWLGDTEQGLRLHIQALSDVGLFLYREKPDEQGKHKEQQLKAGQKATKLQLKSGHSTWALHIGGRDRPHYVCHFEFFPERS